MSWRETRRNLRPTPTAGPTAAPSGPPRESRAPGPSAGTLVALPLHPELSPVAGDGGPTQMFVRVPFAFVAGTSELPAGSYQLQADEQGGFLMRDAENFIRAVLPARLSRGAGGLLTGAKLLFHRFGPHFVVSGVWPGLAPQ